MVEELGLFVWFIFSTWPENRDVVWPQLLLWKQTGGMAHEVMSSEGLGESNDVPDAGSSHDDGHQPVQT